MLLLGQVVSPDAPRTTGAGSSLGDSSSATVSPLSVTGLGGKAGGYLIGHKIPLGSARSVPASATSVDKRSA